MVGTVTGTVAQPAGHCRAEQRWPVTFNFGQQTGAASCSRPFGPADMVPISVIVIAVAVLGQPAAGLEGSKMDPITALRHV